MPRHIPGNLNNLIMSNVINGTVPTVLKSTNFNIQAVMLLVFAGLELIGFPLDAAEEIKTFVFATVATGTGFVGFIRAWIAKGIKLEYTGNVLTYVFAFLSGVVGWFGAYSADLQGSFGSVIDAVTSGNINAMLLAGFTLINIIVRITQDKPWANAA